MGTFNFWIRMGIHKVYRSTRYNICLGRNSWHSGRLACWSDSHYPYSRILTCFLRITLFGKLFFGSMHLTMGNMKHEETGDRIQESELKLLTRYNARETNEVHHYRTIPSFHSEFCLLSPEFLIIILPTLECVEPIF